MEYMETYDKNVWSWRMFVSYWKHWKVMTKMFGHGNNNVNAGSWQK